MSTDGVWRGRTIAGLILLAIIQLGVLLSFGAPRSELATSFGSVAVVDEDGRSESLASGEKMLVLVFHSECAYCAAIAPEWADWLRASPPNLRIVAVSREPYDAASAYATQQGWEVAVRSVPSAALGSPGFDFARRTPWVFGLGAAGEVISTGHGSEIDRVARELLGS